MATMFEKLQAAFDAGEDDAPPSAEDLIDYMNSNFMSLPAENKVAVLRIPRQAGLITGKNYVSATAGGVILDLTLMAEHAHIELNNMVNLVKYLKTRQLGDQQ